MGYVFSLEGFLNKWWEILVLGRNHEEVAKSEQEKIDKLSDMQFSNWQKFHEFFRGNTKFFDADKKEKLDNYLKENGLPEFELPKYLEGYKMRFWMFASEHHPIILVVDAIKVQKTKEGYKLSHILASYEPNDLLR
ncbi:MAG: hypothetical protein DSO07_10170 [Thermoproteota archaeon]|jgi:hypothetical protein|uniref:Uncharacterized protein n=1 Tax=Candidatus Methanodesulfokora washburnensis TaxID=2478471 RepID=A0A3R9Q0Z0_9CREN|nr:hypothetical protein [Candidatus Methanodesulfokores washburnensis]RSN78349.1 hypothetical protein D6D85_01300 [Candidatus Methanodesulfokores washburnensis]TDA39697.1 MAG: hypothetical protein DSO07_10170 [Candidatus Korarchaeota archaeon]